jgi:hypothetical protein
MTEEERRALDIKTSLANFTGTESWFRHSLMRHVLYTEGVQFVAEQCSAYWLIDKIASMQLESKIAAEQFQVWRLAVNRSDNTALLTCTDGGKSENNGVEDILHSEHIHFTDFPLDEIDLWVEGDVILLPSEH